MVDPRDPGDGWYVHLSVDADEGRRLLAVARGIVHEHGASLVASPGSDLKELVLFSREDDEVGARAAVIETYQRLRRAAGLDVQPERVVALERSSQTSRGRSRSRHRLDVRLMHEAKGVLNSESHHEWVVVLAQTACEVYVRDILRRRAAQLGDTEMQRVALLPSGNLDNGHVRRVFEDLTDYSPPTDAGWWRDYQAHAQRRHKIVHHGARITRADAESSIKAAEAMIAFLHWPRMRIESRDAK